jgi:hypothetical protein
VFFLVVVAAVQVVASALAMFIRVLCCTLRTRKSHDQYATSHRTTDAATLWCGCCAAVFVMRTVTRVLQTPSLDSLDGNAESRATRKYFLLIIGVLQLLISFFLVSNVLATASDAAASLIDPLATAAGVGAAGLAVDAVAAARAAKMAADGNILPGMAAAAAAAAGVR